MFWISIDVRTSSTTELAISVNIIAAVGGDGLKSETNASARRRPFAPD